MSGRQRLYYVPLPTVARRLSRQSPPRGGHLILLIIIRPAHSSLYIYISVGRAESLLATRTRIREYFRARRSSTRVLCEISKISKTQSFPIETLCRKTRVWRSRRDRPVETLMSKSYTD